MNDLTAVVRELEQHAAQAGWDQPAQLFALVPTDELTAREPGLAEMLDASGGAGSLTPVQQEQLPGEELEVFLQSIVWPPDVAGAAAIVERLILPPHAEADLPQDAAEAARYAAEHPDREEVRIVAAATRDGESMCALRVRSLDEDAKVAIGPDLVPGLLELLHATLEEPDDE